MIGKQAKDWKAVKAAARDFGDAAGRLGTNVRRGVRNVTLLTAAVTGAGIATFKLAERYAEAGDNLAKT
ncbi:MAG: hypothetical protein U9N14_06545, partial [Pseudomonadota bacterium]|nr:hypothetical protein [Pseudomonadota bacterium]